MSRDCPNCPAKLDEHSVEAARKPYVSGTQINLEATCSNCGADVLLSGDLTVQFEL